MGGVKGAVPYIPQKLRPSYMEKIWEVSPYFHAPISSHVTCPCGFIIGIGRSTENFIPVPLHFFSTRLIAGDTRYLSRCYRCLWTKLMC